MTETSTHQEPCSPLPRQKRPSLLMVSESFQLKCEASHSPVHTHIHICMMYMYVCVYMYIYMRSYVHIHIYMKLHEINVYMYSHTYTHTHILSRSVSLTNNIEAKGGTLLLDESRGGHVGPAGPFVLDHDLMCE